VGYRCHCRRTQQVPPGLAVAVAVGAVAIGAAVVVPVGTIAIPVGAVAVAVGAAVVVPVGAVAVAVGVLVDGRRRRRGGTGRGERRQRLPQRLGDHGGGILRAVDDARVVARAVGVLD